MPAAPPQIDIADETWIVADQDALATVLGSARLWREWWPSLDLTVTDDRGREGVRWSVTMPRTGMAGTAEWWLEPWGDGVIVHWFVRVRPAGTIRRSLPRRNAGDRTRRDLVLSYKRRIHGLKDELERERAAGVPRVGASG